jgi:translation initiation factor 1
MPKERWKGDAPPGPFNNAFGALKDAVGEVPPAPLPPSAPQADPSPAKGPARAVVRLEKKGRGGKQVTVVEKLDLSAAALAEWAQALKQSLGCGGAVDDAAIVVQGDHRERIRAWLEARGVKRISVG